MSIDDLIRAVQSLNSEDAFRPRLTGEQWRSLAPYMVQGELRTGDRLIQQGDLDRTMYLLAQGTLQVYGGTAASAPGLPPSAPAAAAAPVRIAILRAGAVVGESGLFTEAPRRATVEAMTPCSLWALRGARLDELAQRMPTLACEVLRAAGAVMAVRLRAHVAPQAPCP